MDNTIDQIINNSEWLATSKPLLLDESTIMNWVDWLMTVITSYFNTVDIVPSEVQQNMLNSHIKAMVKRALSGEVLPEVDIALFDEISTKSIELAKEIVNRLPRLEETEAYLLSVHFAVILEQAS